MKAEFKTKIDGATTLENLEKIKQGLYAEIYDMELEAEEDALQYSKLRIHVAQCANLRFHQINDDLEAGPVKTKGVLKPTDILPRPSELLGEKKIIIKDTKVVHEI